MAPLRISKGYFLACVAASSLFVFILVFFHQSSVKSASFITHVVSYLFFWGLVFSMMLLIALVPVLIAVLISEFFKLRTIWFHVLCGVLIGITVTDFLGDENSPSSLDLLFLTAPSVLGSVVYWWVSGRFAGKGPWVFSPPLQQGILEGENRDEP